MREELLVYSRRLAVALRGVRETWQPLSDKLPDSFLWPLAVILASWDLSRQDKNKAALNRLLGPGGVPAMWVYLDMYSALLNPVSESITKHQDPAYLAQTVTNVMKEMGLRMVGEVLKSQQFRYAAKFINSQIPERAAIASNKPKAPESKVVAAAENPELINLALQYLIFLGYSTTEASNYVAGKKG
jgi:hypothetical protein